MTPFILMIALSLHSIFEGIAVGLASDMKTLINFIVAILLHKWAASMSLGISISRVLKNDQKTIIWLIILFSAATPLGIAIGMIATNASEMTDICFTSLAGGII
jgi:zinc transporter 1/2/3